MPQEIFAVYARRRDDYRAVPISWDDQRQHVVWQEVDAHAGRDGVDWILSMGYNADHAISKAVGRSKLQPVDNTVYVRMGPN